MSLEKCPSAPPISQERYDANHLKTLMSIYKKDQRSLTSFQLRIFKALEKTIHRGKLQLKARKGECGYVVTKFCIDCQWKSRKTECVQVCEYFRRVYPQTSHLYIKTYHKRTWWSDRYVEYMCVYFKW